ncbi:hypothetical protein D3C85_805040 [compost metagenome]
MSFKVGDKVKCINGDDWTYYEAGEIYEVIAVWEDGFDTKYGPVSKDLYEDFELVVADYSTKHYDSYYHLTEKDISEGKLKVDAYFVAKQWKTGSRDDSGALFHQLKTIARFGEKNSIEREIKALYNQAKALGRIYGVDLED